MVSFFESPKVRNLRITLLHFLTLYRYSGKEHLRCSSCGVCLNILLGNQISYGTLGREETEGWWRAEKGAWLSKEATKIQFVDFVTNNLNLCQHLERIAIIIHFCLSPQLRDS